MCIIGNMPSVNVLVPSRSNVTPLYDTKSGTLPLTLYLSHPFTNVQFLLYNALFIHSNEIYTYLTIMFAVPCPRNK